MCQRHNFALQSVSDLKGCEAFSPNFNKVIWSCLQSSGLKLLLLPRFVFHGKGCFILRKEVYIVILLQGPTLLIFTVIVLLKSVLMTGYSYKHLACLHHLLYLAFFLLVYVYLQASQLPQSIQTKYPRGKFSGWRYLVAEGMKPSVLCLSLAKITPSSVSGTGVLLPCMDLFQAYARRFSDLVLLSLHKQTAVWLLYYSNLKNYLIENDPFLSSVVSNVIVIVKNQMNNIHLGPNEKDTQDIDWKSIYQLLQLQSFWSLSSIRNGYFMLLWTAASSGHQLSYPAPSIQVATIRQ